MITIFKKGDTAHCENYRPISLLQIGYKLFALVLLKRLKKAGAESRIWPTQFGFKSKSGTRDALFLARRMIERAWEQQNGKLIYLALDWAKAFDSISPDALVAALKHFGVPEKMLKVIRSKYTNRWQRFKPSHSNFWHLLRLPFITFPLCNGHDSIHA